MPIPGFQEFMLPFLRLTADGNEHSIPEAVTTLADQMKISTADRDAMQPSGTLASVRAVRAAAQQIDGGLQALYRNGDPVGLFMEDCINP
jgi:restriction endonuclease Mrr